MKKLILIISILIMLISCNFQTDDEIRNDSYGNIISGHYLYNIDFGYADNPNDTLDEKIKKIVINIVRQSIVYKEIDSFTLANPKEIWERGWADCDGYAILLENILYFELGVRAGMILTYYVPSVSNNTGRTIVDGGRVNHAAIYIGNNYYSAQSGERIYPTSIGYLYSFRAVFSGSLGINLLE